MPIYADHLSKHEPSGGTQKSQEKTYVHKIQRIIGFARGA